jgi:hypothetical protein
MILADVASDYRASFRGIWMAILYDLEIILANTSPTATRVVVCKPMRRLTRMNCRRRGFGSGRINYIFKSPEQATLHAGYPW